MSSHEEGLVERLRTTKRELLADPEVDALFEEAASKIEQLERTYAHEQRLSYSLTKENNRLTERVKELEAALDTAIDALREVERDTFYEFDSDLTPEAYRLISRLERARATKDPRP